MFATWGGGWGVGKMAERGGNRANNRFGFRRFLICGLQVRVLLGAPRIKNRHKMPVFYYGFPVDTNGVEGVLLGVPLRQGFVAQAPLRQGFVAQAPLCQGFVAQAPQIQTAKSGGVFFITYQWRWRMPTPIANYIHLNRPQCQCIRQ